MEDLEVDDITKNEKRKKLNSGDKGKRVERQLVKVLNDRFGGGFSRSVGSGNRIGQVSYLPTHARDTFTGDLVCPENFRWCFECKGGYNEIDLCSAFEDGSAALDKFLQQAEEEAKNCGRKPLLLWKKDRKPWLVFVKSDDLPEEWKADYQMQYKDWMIVSFNKLLKEHDSYWIKS